MGRVGLITKFFEEGLILLGVVKGVLVYVLGNAQRNGTRLCASYLARGITSFTGLWLYFSKPNLQIPCAGTQVQCSYFHCNILHQNCNILQFWLTVANASDIIYKGDCLWVLVNRTFLTTQKYFQSG